MSPDPLYDKDANKPWWELAWNAIVNWLAGVAKWFSEIDIGIKIGVGLLLFAAACALVIMSALTGGVGFAGAIAAYTGMSNTIAAATVAGMAITYAVGIASAAALGAVSALLSGGDIVEVMTNAVADAIFWGGVFAFISAGINALKTVARTTYNAKLPGSSQTGAQPCSTVNQCFKEGTLVETEDGLKPIEEIEVGDKVLAYDEATGEQAYKPVLRLFRNRTNKWQYVYIEGESQPIISTPGHKYYLPENDTCREETRPYEHAAYAELSEKWVSACDLKPGDKVLLSDGKYGKVLKSVCVQLDVPETTYNLEVSDFHTYYVGNTSVLVHNNNCGMKNQVIFNKDINGYKNVRMDLEMGGSGKANLHIHVGKDKFIFNGTTYVNTRGQTVPNVIANSKTVSVGLEKATIYAKKLGWPFP